MSRNVFQPPKWCCLPKEPEKHERTLVWVDKVYSSRLETAVGSKSVYTIGRMETDLILQGEMASRLHAAILLDAEGCKFLVDLKSTHGTFLGSQRLTPNVPVRWATGERASFGSGPKAEIAELKSTEASGSGEKRKGEADSGDDEPPPKKQMTDDELMASLYGDMPEATVVAVVPRSESIRPEPLPAAADPTKIIFLDIDGCLRPVHGRKGFEKNVRSMMVDGQKVALLGDGEAKAGLIALDFWPQALRALRHIVSKTDARIVLSSDWRKADELMEGINGQLEEHRMPKLFDATPDLDKGGVGVMKAIHGSFQEKRCKEIRKWLRQHPKIERFCAIDDIDLGRGGRGIDEGVNLDCDSNFVKCAPMTGLTLELAKIAVCFLNDQPVSQEMMEAAYSNSGAQNGEPAPFAINMGGSEAFPGEMPGLA